jgi:hypothetical protein
MTGRLPGIDPQGSLYNPFLTILCRTMYVCCFGFWVVCGYICIAVLGPSNTDSKCTVKRGECQFGWFWKDTIYYIYIRIYVYIQIDEDGGDVTLIHSNLVYV